MTLVNGELSTDAPFGSAAHKYLQAGWPVFTLPHKQKFPPPPGATGWRGRDLSTEQVEDLQRRNGKMNIGVRAPAGVIGIDVDAYGGKEGSRTLTALETELGRLPDTPILTSRDDGISGIRFYRLPGDEVLQGVMGPGIEVIQRHHRYAVAAPSAHPKNDDPYRWLNPDHSEAPDIPRVADLPVLPQAWMDEFSAEASAPGGPAASSGMVQVWLSAHDTHVACPKIDKAVEEFVADEGSRHDSMLKAQLTIANLGAMGHRGASDGLEQLREAFLAAIGDDRDAEDEWYEALAGAIGIVHGDPPTHTGCCSTPTGKPPLLNVPNAAEAPDYFLQQLAENQALFGTFTFGDSFVWTPRLGETGYTPPKEGDDNGPAMIQQLDAIGLTAFVNGRVWLYDEKTASSGRVIRARTFGSGWQITARRARHHDGIPVLRGVTHTPCLKPDGSVLDVPGYDPMSGLAYMPLRGLEVPPIPAVPTPTEVAAAAQFLLDLISEFPWVSEMDRNNFLAMWLSPLILPLLAEPGPLGLINAPMMGSGKTLLSKVLTATHGAVLRGQLPTESEEQRKQITSLLTQTTAPVVIWDNVAGTVRSEHLASLTTKPEWTDRILGATQEVSVPAKRLFVLNGNNISLGGDLARRGVWATIDPDMPKPWERTGYKYEHLDRYVASHRGEVLAALLTLIRAWVAAGCPQATVRSDSFSEWFGTMNGILTVAGIEGGVGTTEKDTSINSEDDDELQEFLAALWDVFGDKQFVSGDAASACVASGGGYSDLGRALPQDMHDRLAEGAYRPERIAKALGRYMARYEGRWTALGYTIRKEKRRDDTTKNAWRVLRRGSSPLSPLFPNDPADAELPDPPEQEEFSSESSSCERPDSNGVNGKRGTVFFDLETCSADRLWTMDPDPSYVRLMAYGDESGVTVTVDHDEMRRVLTEAGTLVGHNIYDFDLKAAARHLGLDFDELLDKSIDTLVLARLKWPVEATKDRQPEHGHGLDELSQRFLGLGAKAPLGATPSGKPRTLAAYAAMCNQRAKLKDKYAAIPTDDQKYRDYCAQDVALLPAMLEAVQAQGDQEYARRELEYLRSLARMSYRGLRLDADLVTERVREEQDRVNMARDWFNSRGIEVKKRLSKSGRDAFGRLLEQAGFTVPRTANGEYCTAADVLIKAQVDHEALRYLAMLNQARGLPNACVQVLADDGRVHPSVQASQASGRLSIKKPALTTFGANERRNLTDRDLFVAAEGHLLLAVDLNAIDVRGMAWHSQDQAMIERLQPGKDWHAEMAMVVYGDPSKRKVAKPLSHSINYSSGPANLAQSAGISYEEAVTLIQQLDETFSELAEFKARVGALAKSGALVPNGWGRLMRPDTDSAGRALTTGAGLSGQGWARDALAECQLRLEQKGLGQYIVLSIHDELVFELPECEAETLRDEIVEVMTFDLDGVPILCKPSRLATRWSDCYRNED